MKNKTKIKTLRDIFMVHSGKVSDKWSIYLAEYDRLFQPCRNRSIRLLEIGVQNGGSLEIWAKFFGRAEKLVGCDVNSDCAKLKFDDPKISVVVANANTDEAQRKILSHASNLDIVIDDASHHSKDIVCSFARYFSYLNDGGLYVVEDMHCSYWQDFEGGIYQPYSSMAFFKLLADTINHEHWGVEKTRCDLLQNFNQKFGTTLDEDELTHIHSIEFINSMCVIRKAAPLDNFLGERLIVGQDALVLKDILQLRGTNSTPPKQNTNVWSVNNNSLGQEPIENAQGVTNLKQLIIERDEEIARLSLRITEREQEKLQQMLSAADQEHEVVLTHTALERELQEKLISAKQALKNLEKNLAEKLDAKQKNWGQERQGLQLKIKLLEETLHVAEQDKLQLQLLASIQQGELEQRHTEREQATQIQLTQARQQLEAHLLDLARREKEFSKQQQETQQACSQELLLAQQDTHKMERNWAEKLAAQQQEWEQEKQSLESQSNALKKALHVAEQSQLQYQHVASVQQSELVQAHVEREQATLAQLTQAHQQIEIHLLELARREKEFSKQRQETQQAYNQQLLLAQQDTQKLEQNWAKSLADHQKKSEQERQNLQLQVKALEEKLHVAEQGKLQLQLAASIQQSELEQRHAEREQTTLAQLAHVREQLEVRLLELAQREKEFAKQQQESQKIHYQEIGELSNQHNRREQAIKSELQAKQEELLGLIQCHEEERKTLAQAQNQLQTELAVMRATRSWRWTSPLRNLFISQSKSNITKEL